jgi:carbamoyltransferase
MEFGPRALGNRSILADARNVEMQKKLNLKIKYRESFRPFAPSVLIEHSKEYFESGFASPYMLLIDYINQNHRNHLPDNYNDLFLNEKLYFVKSDISAITHLDFSARVQTVHQEINPKYWKLIQSFRKITGYGIIVNTSFNVRGEPIVCSPLDAYRCFMHTEMDYLVLNNFIFDKNDQPEFKDDCYYKEKIKPD